MIKCSCGKTIEKMPVWLESVKVEFVCGNCPKRQQRQILTLQTEASKASKIEEQEVSLDDLDDEEELD